MQPEDKARESIDRKLERAGWIVQDMAQLNLVAGRGLAGNRLDASVNRAPFRGGNNTAHEA